MERYLTELLTDLPRKNCDTIAAAVAETSTERLQHLLTDATWDPQALDQQRVTALVAQRPPQGLLVLDDTGLPKPGRGSVGVARQYAGTLGKVANCQIIVSAHYVADEPTRSAPVHWPLSAQLYLPEAWATDPARRSTVHVPAEVALQTKPELALTLVDQARKWGVPFAVVVTDAGYGDNPTFLAGLDTRDVAYVVGVSGTFGVRRPDEVQAAAAGQMPGPRGRGQPKKPHPRRCIRPRWCWRPCRPTGGRRSPGVSMRAPCSANNLSPCGCTGRRVGRSSPRVTRESTRGPRAGCSASARGREPTATSSGMSVTCQRTPRCNAWPRWSTAAGRLRNSTRTPRANVAWMTTRADAGMACIGPLPSLCWRIAFWPASGGDPPTRQAFSPSGERLSFPAVHRQVLLWLFPDVVLWLIATNHISQFRPRQI